MSHISTNRKKAIDMFVHILKISNLCPFGKLMNQEFVNDITARSFYFANENKIFDVEFQKFQRNYYSFCVNVKKESLVNNYHSSLQLIKEKFVQQSTQPIEKIIFENRQGLTPDLRVYITAQFKFLLSASLITR